MRVDAFDYDLPDELIAQEPAEPRDSARLLEVGPGAALADRRVGDLPDLLRPGDHLVFNDTAVIPARLEGYRDAVAIEATLHKRAGAGRWHALARPAKRLKPGQVVRFADDFAATVAEKPGGGEVVLDFGLSDGELLAALERHGRMPLPPYIRGGKGEARDRQRYQTVFARQPGAVAAPTAALHFTQDLLARLEAAGVKRSFLTLHVGAGTFLPVKAEDTGGHEMHAEIGHLPAETAEAINATRAAGGRIIAVGTTVTRLLESAAGADGTVAPFTGETDLFITPGYRYRAIDLMLTNFHLPRSTLLMMVAAFTGLARIKAAYRHAVAQGYRFYSYGDACLLHPLQAGESAYD